MSAHTPFLNLSPANTLEDIERWCVQFLKAKGRIIDGDSDAETCAIKFLEERDYIVFKNGKLEKPKILAARLGVSVNRICNARKHPLCPPHHAVKGKGGNTLAISSNPAFEAFIIQHLAPSE